MPLSRASLGAAATASAAAGVPSGGFTPDKRIELETNRLKLQNDARATLLQALAGGAAARRHFTWRQLGVTREGQRQPQQHTAGRQHIQGDRSLELGARARSAGELLLSGLSTRQVRDTDLLDRHGSLHEGFGKA